MSEDVLVVPARLLREVGYFQGYTTDVERYLAAFFAPGNSGFIPRERAEQDPEHKQLIPYVVLVCGDTVFSYTRGSGSGEKRLVARRSLGVGGHINPADDTLFAKAADIYREAARREVEEEVRVESEYSERIVALINDDSTSVGQVHLGIVHRWDLKEPRVVKRERQITKAEFLPLARLGELRPQMESWSQIALDILADPTRP